MVQKPIMINNIKLPKKVKAKDVNLTEVKNKKEEKKGERTYKVKFKSPTEYKLMQKKKALC